MQKLIALILLMTLLVPVGLKVAMVADYVVRYDYYANELCENKDQPALKCHGTCQLNDNLKQVSEQKSEKPSLPSSAKLELPAFILNAVNASVYFLTNNHRNITDQFLSSNYQSIAQDVNTPPPSL